MPYSCTMAKGLTISTKERLLRAAERLFARHGIDAVSMRRICAEAKQRNNNALQYHFGSKEQLVEAILAARMEVINEHRQAMLDEVLRDGKEDDLPRLVAAIVVPFARQLADRDGGRDYLRFAAQLFSQSDAIELLGRQRPWTEAPHAIFERIHDCLSDLPEHVVSTRLALMASQLVHATAARERELGEGKVRPQSIERFTAELVDYVVGGLSAPVTSPGAHDKRADGSHEGVHEQ
ncbi:MAG: TetR family transcriptional regulator [Deltaproteobacteria bacterium]|nr:TetR family transcriptional regulator [Deltaproteobacteria bacterium]